MREFALLLLLAVFPMQTPVEKKDQETMQEYVRLWPELIAQAYARADKNKEDPIAAIRQELVILAYNPYFDLDREARLHPKYIGLIKDVAQIRGVQFSSPSSQTIASAPLYHFSEGIGFSIIPIGIAIVWIRAWTRRVARKMTISPRSKFYWRLAHKMTSRALVVWIALVILLVLSRGNQPMDDKSSIAILLLVIACPCAALITSHAAAKIYSPPSLPQSTQTS